MDTQQLSEYARIVQVLVGASTRREVERAVERLAQDQAWDFCGAVLLAASELGARVLVAKLLELEIYGPLALAAAMRREIKRPFMQERGKAGRRVFRDIDMEGEEAAIPDHIQAELEDLAAMAEEAREIADRQEADRDVDPIRTLIVNELAKAIIRSEEAQNALVAVVKASAWEETRRSAALRLVTQPLALKRLSSAGRVDDLVAIANCCRLDSASQRIAEALTPQLDTLVAQQATKAVSLIAKYHPDAMIREKAARAISDSGR